MTSIIHQEYDAFARLTDALLAASSAAKDVASTRPDQSRQWEKVGEALEVVRLSVFRLVGEGVTGRQNS